MSIGEEKSAQQQLDAVLDGLPSEYEALVTLITSKPDWFEFNDVQALLLAHENHITKHKDALDSVPSLNLTLFSLWHNRLGHPKATVLQNVLKACNISTSNKHSDNNGIL